MLKYLVMMVFRLLETDTTYSLIHDLVKKKNTNRTFNPLNKLTVGTGMRPSLI
jgi:hypothetical protein